MDSSSKLVCRIVWGRYHNWGQVRWVTKIVFCVAEPSLRFFAGTGFHSPCPLTAVGPVERSSSEYLRSQSICRNEQRSACNTNQKLNLDCGTAIWASITHLISPGSDPMYLLLGFWGHGAFGISRLGCSPLLTSYQLSMATALKFVGFWWVSSMIQYRKDFNYFFASSGFASELQGAEEYIVVALIQTKT